MQTPHIVMEARGIQLVTGMEVRVNGRFYRIIEPPTKASSSSGRHVLLEGGHTLTVSLGETLRLSHPWVVARTVCTSLAFLHNDLPYVAAEDARSYGDHALIPTLSGPQRVYANQLLQLVVKEPLG